MIHAYRSALHFFIKQIHFICVNLLNQTSRDLNLLDPLLTNLFTQISTNQQPSYHTIIQISSSPNLGFWTQTFIHVISVDLTRHTAYQEVAPQSMLQTACLLTLHFMMISHSSHAAQFHSRIMDPAWIEIPDFLLLHYQTI